MIQLHAGGFILWREQVLIIKRANAAVPFAGLWELPSGAVKAHEKLFDACRRETQEETGIVVDTGEAASAMEYWKKSGKRTVHCVQINFICPVQSQDLSIKLGQGHEAYRWVSVESLGEELVSPELRRAWITAMPRMQKLLANSVASGKQNLV